MKRTANVSFRTFPESKEALQRLAAENDIPVASLVRMLLNEALKARGLTRSGAHLRRAA